MQIDKVKKYVFSIFVVVAAAIGTCVSSCGKSPFACFKTSVDPDSVKVNETITFNASCSIGGDYYWQFTGTADSSIEFGSPVVKIFTDTGKVNVMLLVTSGNKSGSTNQTLTVSP